MVAVLHRIRHAALRIRLRTIFTIGSIGLPVALLLVAGLVAQQTERGASANLQLQRLTAANTQTRTLFSLLQDAESGQRGFLLTGQERFLEPYDKAVAQAPAALKHLDMVAAVSPSSAADVEAVRKIARIKLAEMARTIQLAHAGRTDEALALVRSGAGQNQMNQIRRGIADLHAPVAKLIAVQTAERRDSIWMTEELAGALLAMVAVFGAFSAAMLFLNLKEGERIITEKDRTETERVKLLQQLGEEHERLMSTIDQLAAAKYAADQANRAKSDFLASMSHELRTPLNAILGFSEVIKDELFGPVGLTKYVDYAEDVHKSGQLLLDLINDVLDLSKIDAGKVEIREEIVAVPALIQDCIVLVRERAFKAGVSLAVAPVDGAPRLRGDARLLKQILLNLLSNAVKFTPRGGMVSVSGALVEEGFRICVSDTGMGMSAEDIEIAMSAYGQIDSHIARKHQGTGLGLPISRSLAQLHGGTLTIHSEPGKGTQIELTLPADRVVADGPLRAEATG